VAYDLGGVRPQRARRKVDGARVARVSERVAGGAIPDFSKTSLPAPRLPAVPSRESPLEPRPVGTVPECVPPWRHTLGEDSPAYGNVSRAGDGCGVVVSSTKRRWHDHRPASQTGQGGACSRSARNRRSPPLPRPEQLRVEGSPLSRGRRDHCAASKARGPGQHRWSRRPAPPRPSPRRAAPPDDY